MSNLNVLTRRQQGQTCWFHGVINGLLMSWKARRVLEQSIPIVNTHIGGRSIFDADSCPMKRASGDLFWSYVVHRLSASKGGVNARYTNANVIRNLGIRQKGLPSFAKMLPRFTNNRRTFMKRFMSARSSVVGGTFSDMLNVYDKMFPGESSIKSDNKPTTFVIQKGKNFAKYIRHAGHEYDLSHCYIQVMLRGSIGGHVVTGYLTRQGNYNVYDSGRDRLYRMPWYSDEPDADLIQIIREQYHIPVSKISKWAVYVRSDRV